MKIVNQQKDFCGTYNVDLESAKLDQLVVVSEDVFNGALVEGVRYDSSDNMSGWWLTSKSYSGNTDDLKLEHISHIYEKRKDLIKFLGLPFGFKFFQEKYVSENSPEDVWFDEDVLNGIE